MNDRRARTTLEFRVRYSETDHMGVVYHANYLVWCEIGRTELIRRRGESYASLERRGVLLAVSDASIRYHAPARYDDLIRVECWVDELRSRTVKFGYLILRVPEAGEPERLATAETTLVALDRDSRSRKLSADVMEMLEDD